LFKKVLS
jgi:hypothetical protein